MYFDRIVYNMIHLHFRMCWLLPQVPPMGLVGDSVLQTIRGLEVEVTGQVERREVARVRSTPYCCSEPLVLGTGRSEPPGNVVALCYTHWYVYRMGLCTCAWVLGPQR